MLLSPGLHPTADYRETQMGMTGTNLLALPGEMGNTWENKQNDACHAHPCLAAVCRLTPPSPLERGQKSPESYESKQCLL
jgi:hypothetical protein